MKSIWEIIGALSGVLAVAVAVFVFFQGRSEQSKRIEVQLVARSTLVDTTVSGAAMGVEVLYAGRKIPNYAILQIRIANIGGQPVRTADYEVPIEIQLQNISEILSVAQSSADPKELEGKPVVKDKGIQLIPLLLNPGDSVTVAVGVIPIPGGMPSVAPQGRIAGVKRIGFKDTSVSGKASEPTSTKWVVLLALVQGLFAIATMAVAWRFRRLPRA